MNDDLFSVKKVLCMQEHYVSKLLLSWCGISIMALYLYKFRSYFLSSIYSKFIVRYVTETYSRTLNNICPSVWNTSRLQDVNWANNQLCCLWSWPYCSRMNQISKILFSQSNSQDDSFWSETTFHAGKKPVIVTKYIPWLFWLDVVSQTWTEPNYLVSSVSGSVVIGRLRSSGGTRGNHSVMITW